MTTVVVWVMFVFHNSGGLPTAGIFTYETKKACEEASNFRNYVCLKVEVPKPK